MTPQEVREIFAFKVDAFRYHCQEIQSSYRRAPGMFDKSQNAPEARPIHYHYHALVYELSAAYEMVWQLIVAQKGLAVDIGQVKWHDNGNSPFQTELLKTDERTYRLLEAAHNTEWCRSLRRVRNFLLHRGLIVMNISFLPDKEMSAIMPVIDKKTLWVDYNVWIEEILKLFNVFSVTEETAFGK